MDTTFFHSISLSQRLTQIQKDTANTPESLRAAAKLLEEEAKKLDTDPQMKLAYEYASEVCSAAVVFSKGYSDDTYSYIEKDWRKGTYSTEGQKREYKHVSSVYKYVTVGDTAGSVKIVTILDSYGDLEVVVSPSYI